MTHSRSLVTRAATALALAGTAVAVTACGSSGHATARSGAATGSPTSERTLVIAAPSGSGGRFLTGAHGRTLYLWEADRRDRSSCSGTCAKAWPPVLTSATPSAGSGVAVRSLGTIARGGGRRQVTYRGHPLYYFAGDHGRGSTNGQGLDDFGARWWLVSPAGAAITRTRSGDAHSSSTTAGGW